MMARPMPASPPAWVWSSAQETHAGNRRRSNEDAVLSRAADALWAVADGMGGHQAGEVASHAVTAALAAVKLRGPLSARVDAVEDALLGVNDQLRLHARCQGSGTTIGSTVVVLVARETSAVVLWAGDSRLYRLRDGRLEQVTRDHNPISDLLDSGAVTEQEVLEAETNIITRAVGGQPQLFLDPVVFDVVPGDTYLLCSDGLYRELDTAAIVEGLTAATPTAAAEALLARCLEGRAQDNVSVVVVRPQCC